MTDGRGVRVLPSTQRAEDSSESREEEQAVSNNYGESSYVHEATLVGGWTQPRLLGVYILA